MIHVQNHLKQAYAEVKQHWYSLLTIQIRGLDSHVSLDSLQSSLLWIRDDGGRQIPTQNRIASTTDPLDLTCQGLSHKQYGPKCCDLGSEAGRGSFRSSPLLAKLLAHRVTFLSLPVGKGKSLEHDSRHQHSLQCAGLAFPRLSARSWGCQCLRGAPNGKCVWETSR